MVNEKRGSLVKSLRKKGTQELDKQLMPRTSVSSNVALPNSKPNQTGYGTV